MGLTNIDPNKQVVVVRKPEEFSQRKFFKNMPSNKMKQDNAENGNEHFFR